MQEYINGRFLFAPRILKHFEAKSMLRAKFQPICESQQSTGAAGTNCCHTRRHFHFW